MGSTAFTVQARVCGKSSEGSLVTKFVNHHPYLLIFPIFL